jgi:hypothetical protein
VARRLPTWPYRPEARPGGQRILSGEDRRHLQGEPSLTKRFERAAVLFRRSATRIGRLSREKLRPCRVSRRTGEVSGFGQFGVWQTGQGKPQVAQALVRQPAAELESIIRQLKTTRPAALPGYRMKILDGKHFSATDHRIAETQDSNSAPLPEVLSKRDAFVVQTLGSTSMHRGSVRPGPSMKIGNSLIAGREIRDTMRGWRFITRKQEIGDGPTDNHLAWLER